MTVSERDFTADKLIERAKKPGTAAVLTPVGTLIHNGEEITVGSGEPGETTLKLRQALNDIQWGRAEDKFGWLQKV